MRVTNKRNEESTKTATENISLLLPPETKLRQGNVFTLVCHSVHGGRGPLSGRPPPTETPRTETPQTETPWTETPRTETPLNRDPPRTETPWTETPQTETPWTETPGQRPPCTVTSGRYASYWNAFLFYCLFYSCV